MSAADFLQIGNATPTSSEERELEVTLTPPPIEIEGPQPDDDSDCIIRFPWKRDNMNRDQVGADVNAKPGEYVLQTLFLQFCSHVEKKIEQVLAEPLERPLAKSLQRGEDAQFDQILSALGNVAEQSLPSLLRTLFKWYERQNLMDDSLVIEARHRHKSKGEKDFLCERRDLAVEFVYCLVLIEVLSKLSYHPAGHDDLVGYIITQAFRHFKYRDSLQASPNAGNTAIIADLYAEVIGTVAQARFQAVRKTFLSELRELKLRDQTPYTAQSIISLLMGLKFFRVKMHPIEDFEACCMFLHDLGKYYLEVKDRDIKHALAGLFVEILLPVAASAKNEVNVPVLKTFVDMLYSTTIDMTTKKKHTLALFPLVTCLLCVSHKQFFLNNWPYFLTMCLSQLKNRDTKMSRVALESLYRLLWVYMVRIKCESNTATQSRLQSIVNSLFPKGSKMITPRDTPLNIFVKIIQFIAKERLDFAMKEIIFDLLCVGRQIKFLTPERMSIGLRAFLVIADSLQQKDGDPPMPQTMATLPSGNTVRHKKTFLFRFLTDSTAKLIGIDLYYPHVLKTIDSIFRALDLQVGRPLLLTKTENANKDPEELITTERKPKIDLFRTCVASIPRLIPDGMTPHELIELLTRLTIHVDEELKGLAFQALQNLMHESFEWREQVVRGFVQFVQKEIGDTNTQLLEGTLRMLIQLLVNWKSGGHGVHSNHSFRERDTRTERPNQSPSNRSSANLVVLHEVEGLALIMLCNTRLVTRKLALHLVKEVRTIISTTGSGLVCEPCLIDVLDKACPLVLEKLLPLLPHNEKAVVMMSPNIDLTWVIDRTATVWSNNHHDNNSDGNHHTGATPSQSSFNKLDIWMSVLAGLVSSEFALGLCPHAVSLAWPIVFGRLNALFPHVDPSLQTNETRASSILRSGSKKVTTERDLHMNLWRNYEMMACCIAQKTSMVPHRCASPELSSSPESNSSDKLEARQNGSSSTATSLFRMLVPLMKCDCADMRDAVVNGLGHTNSDVFRELVEELLPYLKEAIDKKQDNIKRRRKRDLLRVQLARIFELMAENKTFAQTNSGVIDKDKHCLITIFVDYIDGARQYLEGESDRDLPILQEIRLHFSGFVHHLIRNTPSELRETLLTRELRYSLFHLFAGWSGRFCPTFGSIDRRMVKEESCSCLELSAVRAMSSVLCCGKVFDPSGLNDDGYVYQWLDILLSSHDEKIYKLAKETVVLLLDCNSDIQGLLDWVIDRCYTGSNEVADGCFRALAAVFQTREYPCDHVAMLNLAVLNVGSPRIEVHDIAIQLIHLLDTRFFQEELVFSENMEENGNQLPSLNDIFLSVANSRSQMFVSEQLARLHPELTMPMFSEITHRFQTARPAIRMTLLLYLLPWLHNMELVDPALPPSNPLSNFLTRLAEGQGEVFRAPLKGDGWGSTQATEMVLNNLFFMTVKFGDDHPREIEMLWAALVMCWPTNLKVVLRYLIIVISMAAELLPYAKRVVAYLGRAKPEKLVDELMNELQTVETLNMSIERTQTPPFYRLSSLRKSGICANTTDDEKLVGHGTDAPLEKGILHTKRHSTLNDDVPSDSTPRTDSTTSLRSISSTSSGATDHVNLSMEDEGCATPTKVPEPRRCESPLPYPLPMPAYGGYFAPLSEYLPETFVPTPGYHRSNISVMLLSELVLDGLEIDWSAHLPLMLHIIFLGLDHSKVLVYEHCKKLLQNLLLLLASSQDHQHIARMLCANKTNLHDTLTLIAEEKAYIAITTGSPESLGVQAQRDNVTRFSIGQSTLSVDSSATVTPDNTDSTQLPDPETITNVDEVMKIIMSLINKRPGRPLWSYEDITSKTLTIQSAAQLEYFLKCVMQVCKELAPLAGVEQRWAQIALQLALSCSSRHYAGRSFQVVRALHVRPSTQMLSDVLSRLVETVAEQGDDMQGYVTEMMLTLEAAVDYLEMEVRTTDFMRELFMSTPNLAKETWAENRKSAPIPPCGLIPREPPPHHNRTTSYSVSVVTGRLTVTPGGDARQRSASSEMSGGKKSNLARSRSAQSLKNLDQNSTEDKLTILTQMFWIAVSMLESDYEYEFQLAVRLLEKILKHLQPGRPDCREKLDKILQQIKWPNFPGVQNLLLKGCTSQGTAELTWSLLSHLTLCINAPVIDPSGALGFPMNVIALLPYLVQNYENPGQGCRDAADHISQACSQQSEHLGHLATVMSLYSHGTFGKDSFQWTKCVVKYLHDVYSCASLSVITFLVEVLERGPVSCQPAVLQILHCLVHYVDISKPPTNVINTELFHNVAKHVQATHWKESLKILKLAVTRASTLTAAPPSMSASVSGDLGSLMAHTSFAEAEVYFKKELPGRTLDFTVNLTKTPIIGRKYINSDIRMPEEAADGAVSNPALALSRKPSTNTSLDYESGWRRPSSSQSRTRERLVNLLTCYGPRVGLPKSPSVIFSQSSDTLEHQQSVASGSSGEEASVPDAMSSDALLNEDGGNELLVFKRFDFLNELEENEDDNYNYSSLSNRPQSLSQLTADRAETPTHAHFGSVPDLNLLAGNADIKLHKSDSVSLKEEEAGMTSDDEESHSESPADDGMPQDLPVGSSIIVENPVLLSSPLTASTHSLHSLHSSYSDGDIVELNSSTASPNFSHLSAAFLNIESDEVEDLWKSHVSKVMADSTAVNVINTCQMFPRLFKELRRRMANLTKEACYYISKTESLKSVAWQILQILNILLDRMACPHVFTEPETIMGTRVVEKHRFCVLEIKECYDTYSMRKDQVEQCLDDLKSSIKQQSLGENNGAICSVEQKMELCRRLYKLHFQLVLLFENYMKFLEVFRIASNSPQVVDFSLQVTILKRELVQSTNEMEGGQVSPLQVDSKVVSKQEALISLAEYLSGEQYLKAIQLLRAYRALWPHDLFGQGCEDDIVALLNIYCRGLAEKKSGVFVMTKVDLDLGQLHSQLMDLHVQLESIWTQISSTSTTSQERDEPECSIIILGESEML